MKPLLFFIMAIFAISCNNSTNIGTNNKSFKKGTFGYDAEFLRKMDSVIFLKSDDGQSQIIVSAKYQGKVFTSTAAGEDGKSLGWINYKAFKNELDPHMNGYGGEDRLWLGPEGGRYSLFFKKGDKMTFENWHTPSAFDSESWFLKSSSDKKVLLEKKMRLHNYIGTTLDINIQRTINILEKQAIQDLLGVELNEGVKSVAFSTVNTLENVGNTEWTTETGAPCLWNLDMFSPSEKTIIIIPYVENIGGKVATSDYFGQIPSNRLTYSKGILYFKADGKSRGKLGLPPKRSKNIAGSFDAENNILTITKFDVDRNGIYLNQEWNTTKNPLIGDAVNAYNDGPLEDGNQMGPFYEIESVSPAAFLKPGKKLTHKHSVAHFTGNQQQLDKLSQELLGVTLKQITNTLKK